MRFKNSIRRICTYFLLMLFLGYYGSITMFYHSHIVTGDTIIVHSHPFRTGSNGLPLHSHTSNGFITIHLLSTILVSLSFLFFGFKTFAPVVNEIILKTKVTFVNNHQRFLYSLRAPPVNMFI